MKSSDCVTCVNRACRNDRIPLRTSAVANTIIVAACGYRTQDLRHLQKHVAEKREGEWDIFAGHEGLAVPWWVKQRLPAVVPIEHVKRGPPGQHRFPRGIEWPLHGSGVGSPR